MRQLKLGEEHDRGRGRTPTRRRATNGAKGGLTRDDILSAVEVAELLQLRRSTVEDYARRGVLPSIKLGRFRRFVRSDIEAELARLRNGGAS